jgi:hypothetical protein
MTLHLAEQTLRMLRSRNETEMRNGGLLGMGRDDVPDMLAHAAVGRRQAVLDAPIAALVDTHALRIDRPSFLILRGMGLDPVALACVATMAPEVVVIDDERPVFEEANVMVKMSTDRCVVVLSHEQGVSWIGHRGHMMIPAVPETVRARLRGRRLADVVGHPATRDLDLGIIGVDTVGRITVLKTLGGVRLRTHEIKALTKGDPTCG